MVEVTQSARDAAARIWRAQGNGFVADAIERGEHDDWPVVQEVAAAEHRGRIAGMREAAGIGYRVCAETRHVTLGYKVEEAIRQRATAIETGEG